MREGTPGLLGPIFGSVPFLDHASKHEERHLLESRQKVHGKVESLSISL